MEKLGKWVPRERTQETCHFKVLSSLLCNNNEPVLDRIVTCDEKWIS